MSAAPARWPRLLSRVDAAEYCGVSPSHFDKTVPLDPIHLGARRVWDREALDQWVTSLANNASPETDWMKVLDENFCAPGKRPSRVRQRKGVLLSPTDENTHPGQARHTGIRGRG